MRKVKTHKFNGRSYKIDIREPVDGYCEQYGMTEADREIAIFCDIKTKNGLITIIHEALHASDWRQDENAVDRVSSEVGNFLWRLGFRIKD